MGQAERIYLKCTFEQATLDPVDTPFLGATESTRPEPELGLGVGCERQHQKLEPFSRIEELALLLLGLVRSEA